MPYGAQFALENMTDPEMWKKLNRESVITKAFKRSKTIFQSLFIVGNEGKPNYCQVQGVPQG